MREFSTPWEDEAEPTDDPRLTGSRLTDHVVRRAEQEPTRVVISRRASGTAGSAPAGAAAPPAGAGHKPAWEPVTARQFLDDVRRTARGLVAAGLEHGDRLLLMARTRYEWTVLDYAAWYVGVVTVPVYETTSVEQVGWVLSNSGARAAVVETPGHAARVEDASTQRAGDAPPLLGVWILDDPGDSAALRVLAGLGDAVGDDELEKRHGAVSAGDVATLVYTSGTMGQSKGCVLTHGNLLVEVAAASRELSELFEEADAATLLVLPLAHVFARVVQVGALSAGVRLGHGGDVRRLPSDLRTFAPSFVLGVPRVFERIFTLASQQAASEGRGRLFDRATDVAIAHSRALDRGRPSPWVRSQHALLERLVYRGLRETLGGRCRFAVSGGAPLGEQLAHFYRGIGVPILEGYGLTESSGAATVNVPGELRVGTVGRPLPGTTIRIADDGEILVAGGQVMRGYWDDPAATAATLTDDGWLRTGDLGEIDDEGFLRVTGRSKEVIVTAGGKNVAPGLLEGRLRSHPLVGACLVVGDGRPYVAALVTLDREGAEAWARDHGVKAPFEALARNPALRAELQAAVDRANAAVSRAESIRRFEVLPGEWTEETGELTPSLKLRRNVLLRRYREEIEALYAD